MPDQNVLRALVQHRSLQSRDRWLVPQMRNDFFTFALVRAL
jgi:hypothetical protein